MAPEWVAEKFQKAVTNRDGKSISLGENPVKLSMQVFSEMTTQRSGFGLNSCAAD